MEQRMELILRHDDGESIVALAESFGVTRKTIYKWMDRYATEGAAACRDFARYVLGAKRLVAIIHPDNRPSQRVAEKIGLRPEKRAVVHGGRDAIIYAAALDQE